MRRRIDYTNSLLFVGVALASMMVVVVVLLMVADSNGDNTLAPPPSAVPRREPVDPAMFLAAYERSISGTFVVRGTQKNYLDGVITGTAEYRHVRDGDKAYLEEGDTALLIDGPWQTTCIVRGVGASSCGETAKAPTRAQRLALVAERFQANDDGDPDYVLYQGDENCWEAIAQRPLPFDAWGQTTTWCFDPETGAQTMRERVSGAERFTATANDISTEVSDDDFKPEDP